MLNWLKKKAVEKQKANIKVILQNLLPLCLELEAQIEEQGGPVQDGPAFELMQRQREELQFQLNGPMTTAEVRSFVEPFLAASGAPRGLRLAVESVIDQYHQATGH